MNGANEGGGGDSPVNFRLERRQALTIAWVLTAVFGVWVANGFWVAPLAKVSVALFWLVDLMQWIVLPLLLLRLLARWAGVRPEHYHLGLDSFVEKFTISSTLGVALTTGAAFFVARRLCWRLFGKSQGIFVLTSVFPTGAMWTIVWLYSAVSAGVVESIFFIGLPWLLYRYRSPRPSPTAFTLIVSVVFAAAHWENGPQAVAGAYLANLIACWWYFKLGTLWPVVAGHCLVDLVAFA